MRFAHDTHYDLAAPSFVRWHLFILGLPFEAAELGVIKSRTIEF